MVERFERNKLYVNSNVADQIVKCDFVAPSGAAVLTRVCKHPDFVETPGWRRVGTEIFSGSPENWDEFTLPETLPGETKWVVSFNNVRGIRTVLEGLHDNERTATDFVRDRPISHEVREQRAYLVHPIIITQRQTLEQFVRSVEEQGDFV